MQEVLLDYGDSHMRVELPDAAAVIRYGHTYTDPPRSKPRMRLGRLCKVL